MRTRGLSIRHVTEPTSPESAFRFATGATAASLTEFHERLATEPAATIAYHRSHFAPWVREVLRDEPLARRLELFAESGAEPETLRDILRDLVERRLQDLAMDEPGRAA